MRHLTSAGTLALTCALAAAPSAHGQVTEAQPGARVRVTAPGVVAASYVGTVLAREPGIMRVASQNTAPIDVPIDRITALEISRGKSRAAGAGRGAIIGTLSGGVVGIVVALSDAESRSYFDYEEGRRDTLSRGEAIGYMAFSGALIGAAIGLLVPKERWERFDLAPRTGVDPRRRRLQLGFSVGY